LTSQHVGFLSHPTIKQYNNKTMSLKKSDEEYIPTTFAFLLLPFAFCL